MTGSYRTLADGVPPLHLITDDRTLLDPGFARRAEEALLAGGHAVALHLRSAAAPTRVLLELARVLAPVAARTGAWLLVNDRADVAMAAGAHGVHLGERSMAVADARALLGPDRRVGASIHSPEEGRAAAREGTDYLLAGTLYATPSHPDRPGAGTAWLAELTRLGPAVIGIGGITPARALEVRAAGAYGVAVLRGVWTAERPSEAVRAYLAAINGEIEHE